MRLIRFATVISTIAAALVLQIAGSPNASACAGDLPANYAPVPPRILNAGQSFTDSMSGLRLQMQGDGNLVLTYTPTSTPVWDSHTAGHGAYFIVQSDGNAVVYDKAHHAVFNTGTSSVSDPSNRVLVIDRSGRLAVLTRSATVLYRSSGRLPSNIYSLVGGFSYTGSTAELVMQPDGNLVSHFVGKVVWNSGTSGHRHAYAATLRNLDFVVMDNTHTYFSTNTASSKCARTCSYWPELLLAWDTGRVSLYAQEGGFLLWNSQFGHTPAAVGTRAAARVPSDLAPAAMTSSSC
jgi:murein DD-endopeptidase